MLLPVEPEVPETSNVTVVKESPLVTARFTPAEFSPEEVFRVVDAT